ncbi:unnamed protein product [Rotaria socialis]|uniref:Uncharacterized protein n=1 Tax=Rotaria socialis TaxID=392032 RepID=A0A820JGF0_9BILA|nr:unnamed protein product [Rotaria socialis]CAF4326732.1 unnamed protein product [Rotaria socialis]
MDDQAGKPYLKIIGLIWILIECSLVAGNIFGFASLFTELPRYGIYQSECRSSLEQNILSETNITKDTCHGQQAKYQLAFALGIAFYNVPAMVSGMISDNFGPRSLKLIAIIFHLISWLSLGFITPDRSWLLMIHTMFLSLSGISTLLASFSISNHFVKSRGLVTALISGSQLTGSLWYAVFQILIGKGLISLSTLSFIWASLSVLMFGSAMLFLDWPFNFIDSTLKSKITKKQVKTITTDDTLIKHLTSPLFIVVTLFLSALLFTISFLPIVWPAWISYLTESNSESITRYTFWFNMLAGFGIFIAPLCGFIVDFRAHRGYTQKMFNISILQTITWIGCVSLCMVCMQQSITAAPIALFILIISRVLLVAGSQALIATVFPPQFIGSLLGVMWTIAGLISFAIYALLRLGNTGKDLWRPWAVILLLCIMMGGHLIQVWVLYIKSKTEKKSQSSVIDEEEMNTLKNSNDN